MPSIFRRTSFWSGAASVLALIAGGGVIASQVNVSKEKVAEGKTAMTPVSPYVAIANGKADVDGGVIAVAARRAGIIAEVFVEEGDPVTKDQLLARLEDTEPRLAAAAAEAELAQVEAQIRIIEVDQSSAKREYERLKALVDSNFIAAQKLDQAADVIRDADARLAAQKAAVASAQAKLEQARYELELTMIRAPADGRIVRRYANPGAGASTLNVSNMFELEPVGKRIVRAELSESALPFVVEGQSVQLSPEADPAKSFPGRVVRRAGVFGARKLQSDDPSERTDERVVEVVVSADGAPFLIGQRVLVKFAKP